MSKKNTSNNKDIELKQVEVKATDIFSTDQPEQPGEPVKKLPEARDEPSHSEDEFDNKYKTKGGKKASPSKKGQPNQPPTNPAMTKETPSNPYASKTPTPYTPVNQNEDYGDEDDDFEDDEVLASMMTNNTKFWQLAHYQGFFNVSTMDVLHRLRKSLWPFCSKSQLFDDDDRVDLFGPFWIMMTLIVEIAIVGFINNQIEIETLALEIKNGQFVTQFLSYNLLKVARSAFVMVGYFLLNPLLCLLLIKYVLWVPDMRYLWLFAIYGYSFTVFIITTGLNVIPIDWLKWVLLAISGVISLFFIFTEMYTLIKDKLHQGVQLVLDKKLKREVIKSILSYSPNKKQEAKRIERIEAELQKKFMRKNHSMQSLIGEARESRQENQDIQQLLESQNPTQHSTKALSVIKKNPEKSKFDKKEALYVSLQSQYNKTLIGYHQPQFLAQKKFEQNSQLFGDLKTQNPGHITLTHHLSMSNLNFNPTSKAKKYIQDKSAMNKSQLRVGVNLPSPIVYKNQVGFTNQSQLRRYENVIGQLQQLALRLDLNRNMLSAQRPILRTFNELHNIQVPWREGDSLHENEEKIILYIERRKFLEVNEEMKQLSTIDDHFYYAIYNHIPEKIIDLNKTLMINKSQDQLKLKSLNNSKMLGINASMSQGDLSKANSSRMSVNHSGNVYQDGFGIAFINEKNGKLDRKTIQYFEIGLSLSRIYSYLKRMADEKNYIILENSVRKLYQFEKNSSGQTRWIELECKDPDMFYFNEHTLYGIAVIPNLIYH